ncbi:MAG TPA: DUF4333 domain-containing protein [Mycobacterium sp.]|uniref:DUF4333 domain-containing protein n=1 Tax=Mycolicibacterium sp. TaxID=2320850 RepID=UPI0025DBE1F9|nr:DUF4333 domain-containing protein [Mycolicibacterium sp.]HPX38527.1 DUF4333 domain-containing protein [Mycobacterium sp.]HQC78619.1 DUF4333 domain-containing protein [Mycobacterium sp.]
MKIKSLAAGAVALTAFALGAGLSGCSAKVESKTAASLSAADLQTKLTEQFAGSKTPPKSVTCKDELVAEVGKTASCDVALSETNNVEAVVTVTGVKDGELSYEISPALSKEQLAQAVSGMTGASTVVCPTGLEGKIGATAQCDTTADGVAAKRLVEVDNVSGLEMDVSMKKVWSKEQVQEILLQKLNADGTPAETVECVDGVVAKTGANVECVTVTGNQKKGYVVTVTTFDDDSLGIDYKDAP